MKTRFFILGAIFTVLSFGARGQVNNLFNQGFEANEQVNYAVTPQSGFEYSTTLYSEGSRSLRLLQSTDEDIMVVTDTIDLRQSTLLRYVTLEFDHYCNIDVNSDADKDIGLVYVKLVSWSDANYRKLGDAEYNRDRDSYSSNFVTTKSFSRNSYSDWGSGSATNSKWKSERFDINDIISTSVPLEERQLVFRFVLKQRTRSGGVPSSAGWWIDNLHVRASQDPMVKPKVKIAYYPDGGAHPSSAGARIMIDARTDVTQGINNDSVYLFYTIGADPTPVKLSMASLGSYTGHDNITWRRFSARIPFCGYDTVMRFRCVVKDGTSNATEATYPAAADEWLRYWCIRGSGYAPSTIPEQMTGDEEVNLFPFGNFADTRCEWVLDSALLASAGYGPGAVTEVRFVVAAAVEQDQTRPNFQLRFKNVPGNYSVPATSDVVPFTSGYMCVGYDGDLEIEQTPANTVIVIPLTDTFFYSGAGIVIQSIHNGTANPGAVKLKMFSRSTTKTKYFYGKSAAYGANAYNDPEMTVSSFLDERRPAMGLITRSNQSLRYDAGVSALVFPSSTAPVVTQPTHIEVTLKNFGEHAFNSAEINYSIDGTINGSHTWTGTLAGGATTTVTVANNLTLPAGFHTIRVWTSDTLGVGNLRYRDHEPLNNASNMNNPNDTSFIVCAGPLSGVRYVGGENADYNTMEEFLFSLSLCGMDDSLVVKLSSDSVYRPFRMPSVNGLTQSHYLVLEPQGERVKVLFDNDNTQYMVNLEDADNVRLRRMDFVRRSGALTNMVVMGQNSANCVLENCTFIDSVSNPAAAMRIAAMVASGFADNLTVRGCRFIGGAVGVDISGQAMDLRSTGATVERCYFSGQYSNALKVQNMTNVTVTKNELYDVTSNSSYVLQAYACYGTVRITANKLYTSHGAGALGVSKVNGTSSNRAIVANNMVVCNDDGASNMLTTPFNIIDGSWIDVVYNSVKMTAPTRSSVAAATFGGPALTNSRFLNNIVTCYDQSDYALNFAGYSQTSNTIGHNVYYSNSYTLNRMGTTSYHNLEQWTAAVPMDDASVSIDPTFLNGSLVDLRTFNRYIKGVGTPITTVTTDMFDTVRGTQHTCPGAFEFVSLYYDFEIESLANPMADVCGMPDNVELVVVLRNSGSSSFVPGSGRSLRIYYSINGGTPAYYQLTRTIPSEDTVSIYTGQYLHMPSNGQKDSVYDIRMWISCTNDPNQTNDTSDFTVVSRYRQPSASDYTQSVPFSTAATIYIPDSSLTMWPVSDNPAAPHKRGNVYWYSAMDDDTYLASGDEYTTGVLRRDTNLYIKQRRELPIVRITQVQIRKGTSTPGLTSPMPGWMSSGGTPVAVQLMNVGDAPAYLQGDTLQTVSPTSTIRKAYRFGNLVLQPGEFVVVQFTTAPATVTGPTVYAPKITMASNTDSIHLGIVYKHNGGVEDAVALNSVQTAPSTTWPDVPEYIWGGSGLPFSAVNSGGIVRTAFQGGSSDWRIATNDNRMFIGTTDATWQRYTDNGCPTEFSTVHLTMQNAPSVDIELTPTELPSGCALGQENVKVFVANFGVQPANNLVLKYTAGGAVVTETLTRPVIPGVDTFYTFLTPLNMAVPHDSTFTVRVYANAHAGDANRSNDTCTMTSTALYTPGMPNMEEPITSQYGQPATLTHEPTVNVMPVWYDNNDNALDTGYTYVTPALYTNDSIQLGYMALSNESCQIGTATTMTTATGNNAYPSPYNPLNKYVKEQFIYTASELNSMGMTGAGNISSIAFYLGDVPSGTSLPLTYQNYYISLGLTSSTTFSSKTDWKTTQVVYTKQNFSLTSSNAESWVVHQFDTPFYWDGVSSLVVEVVFKRSSAVSTGLKTAYSTKSNTALHKADNTNPSGGIQNYTGEGSRTGRRPDIKIVRASYGCSGPKQTVHINLIGQPQYEANITWPAGSDTLVYSSCGHVSMDVTVSNLGANSFNSFELKYSIDGGTYVSRTVSATVAPGATYTLQLMNEPIPAGRHHIDAVVKVAGDTIPANDTIHRNFSVRFCGGTYTIGPAQTADYHTINEALDTMNVVGIDGSVIFNIAAGVYNEQVYIHTVVGSSSTNTVSFVGESDSTTLVTAATTQNANYVFKVDDVANVTIRNMGLISRPASGNYANVIVASNVSDRLTVDNSTVRVKGDVVNENGSGIVLQGNIAGLTVQNSKIDSGYYSVWNSGSVYGYSNFVFRNNQFTNFASVGIKLQEVENIEVTKTDLLSGESTDTRGLQGIYLKTVTGNFMIQKNHIYLIDQKKGGKQGIYLEGAKGSNMQRGYVVNNMVSCYGTGNKGVTPPACIYMLDCEYVNVLFNSMRIYSGSSNASRAFLADVSSSGSSRGIQVMNNIISNFSSYAYEAKKDTLVSASDHNNYYTPEDIKLAKWGSADCNNLAELRAANSKDNSSLEAEPYYVAIDDLHLRMTNLIDKAQYNPDVVDDIDDSIRSQIPRPTIGAQEMFRATRNMSLVRIISPIMPERTNNFSPTNMPPNIESDSVLVKVEFYNNGSTVENNSSWYAYLDLEGYEDVTRSVTRNLTNIQSGEMKIDSVKIPTPMGVIYEQSVRVVLVCPNDADTSDNQASKQFYLAPAFDLKAKKIRPGATGCTLQETPVIITLENVGYKPIPANVPFEIGYHAQGYKSYSQSRPENNKLDISTMPDTIRETHSFDRALGLTATRDITFNTPGNFYPTDTMLDIKVALYGWCRLNVDVEFSNDSTTKPATTTEATASSFVFDSYFSPLSPVGFDTVFPYGTWGVLRAEQLNKFKIFWHRDSTETYFHTGTNYAKSCIWDTTPTFFRDTTYYLQCFGKKDCPSLFSEIHVHVAPHETNDLAVEKVLAPLGSRVYMENDTVRVRIANYGTAPQQNFPVTYQMYVRRGSTPPLRQEVTEICTTTLAPGQTMEYTFDTLLSFNNALKDSIYYLRVWTDLENDAVRRNDTIHCAHVLREGTKKDSILDYKFVTLKEGTYYTHANELGVSDSVDIVRISFNEIELEMPALGRSYNNFGVYNNPEYPVLHVTRGTTDSLVVRIANPSNSVDRDRGRVAAYIDFNRNGSFDDQGETVLAPVALYTDSLRGAVVTIPQTASLGYMKMRVCASDYANRPVSNLAADAGHMVDFMLFVDAEATETDIALTQIVSPRNSIIRDSASRVIRFRMANRGKRNLTDATIHYSFEQDSLNVFTDVVNWSGLLMPGKSTVVSLPAYRFPIGTSTLRIWISTPGDTNTYNDTLIYEYHRFRTIYLTMDDDFDFVDNWYAPRGYNEYSRNYWQRGTPEKSSANFFALSEPNVWCTDLTENIKSGLRGNISYLYSPIIDIAQVRPDTLAFYLVRNLAQGSNAYMEYYSYRNKWEKLYMDSLSTWYNNYEDNTFTGTKTWSRYYICTDQGGIRGNFNEKLQFRIVYTSPQKTSATTDFGAGCAIDDFHIGRGRQRIDVGVVAITYPVEPMYGQTIYPEVQIKNYGLDTVRQIEMGYTYYGRYMARMCTVPCLLPPDSIQTFTYLDPFVVTNDFPDTFSITCFTNLTANDIYRDNDTLTKTFCLTPLGGDIAAVDFIYPRDNVVAGDSIEVTMRIRNAGVAPISNATLTYIVGDNHVTEAVDIVALKGSPLLNRENFNYTFHRKFRSPMGSMSITGIAKCDSNEYHYNDTITKRIRGISSITDVAAAAIVVDNSERDYVTIQLVIENHGSRGANNFEVGFWIDDDTAGAVRETFYRATPLTSFNMTTHLFNTRLRNRAQGYQNVTAFVHAMDDNDPTNDTTTNIVPQYVDLEVLGLIVEENANPDCRVFVHIRNIGNCAVSGRPIPLHANINGNEIVYDAAQRIDPGYDVYIEFGRTIPKSPLRSYIGSGGLREFPLDANPDNNQTTKVSVVNYVEGIPTVNCDSFILGQNYPNPFSGTTTVPFTLPNDAAVTFFVMDAMGKMVYTSRGYYPAGDNTLILDLANFATGVYYYGIIVDGQRQMRKLIVK